MDKSKEQNIDEVKEDNVEGVADKGGNPVDEKDENGVDEVKKALEQEIREQLKKEMVRETDRRVSEALKKREKQLKAEAAEAERKAKLTEEEKLAELKAENDRKLRERELDLNTKELTLKAIDYLTEKGCNVSIKDILNIKDVAVLENAELRESTLKAHIDKTLEVIEAICVKREEALKKEILKGNSPLFGDNKISEYQKAKQNNDVKSMLINRFS